MSWLTIRRRLSRPWAWGVALVVVLAGVASDRVPFAVASAAAYLAVRAFV